MYPNRNGAKATRITVALHYLPQLRRAEALRLLGSLTNGISSISPGIYVRTVTRIESASVLLVFPLPSIPWLSKRVALQYGIELCRFCEVDKVLSGYGEGAVHG